MDTVTFLLPNGNKVPAHFHVTEVARYDKHFVDCGGTERRETIITLQLWTSIDLHHRLKAEKLAGIIDHSVERLGFPDAEVAVEYQTETIGRYGLELTDGQLRLLGTQTDCLAKDACGVPGAITSAVDTGVQKVKKSIAQIADDGGCTPGGGCC